MSHETPEGRRWDDFRLAGPARKLASARYRAQLAQEQGDEEALERARVDLRRGVSQLNAELNRVGARVHLIDPPPPPSRRRRSDLTSSPGTRPPTITDQETT